MALVDDLPQGHLEREARVRVVLLERLRVEPAEQLADVLGPAERLLAPRVGVRQGERGGDLGDLQFEPVAAPGDDAHQSLGAERPEVPVEPAGADLAQMVSEPDGAAATGVAAFGDGYDGTAGGPGVDHDGERPCVKHVLPPSRQVAVQPF